MDLAGRGSSVSWPRPRSRPRWAWLLQASPCRDRPAQRSWSRPISCSTSTPRRRVSWRPCLTSDGPWCRQLVAARDVRPLASLDDAGSRVRGLGPATLARIAPYLRFEPSAQMGLEALENPPDDRPTVKPRASRRKTTRSRKPKSAPLQPRLASLPSERDGALSYVLLRVHATAPRRDLTPQPVLQDASPVPTVKQGLNNP